MTYENCLKYMNEAANEKMRLFWDARIKRKYPDVAVPVVAKEEKVAEKPSKRVKKVKK